MLPTRPEPFLSAVLSCNPSPSPEFVCFDAFHTLAWTDRPKSCATCRGTQGRLPPTASIRQAFPGPEHSPFDHPDLLRPFACQGPRLQNPGNLPVRIHPRMLLVVKSQSWDESETKQHNVATSISDFHTKPSYASLSTYFRRRIPKPCSDHLTQSSNPCLGFPSS